MSIAIYEESLPQTENSPLYFVLVFNYLNLLENEKYTYYVFFKILQK